MLPDQDCRDLYVQSAACTVVCEFRRRVAYLDTCRPPVGPHQKLAGAAQLDAAGAAAGAAAWGHGAHSAAGVQHRRNAQGGHLGGAAGDDGGHHNNVALCALQAHLPPTSNDRMLLQEAVVTWGWNPGARITARVRVDSGPLGQSRRSAACTLAMEGKTAVVHAL